KGTNWLFDLDYLTDSMNYQPVTAENKANKTTGPKEANHSAGTQDNINAGNSEMEAEPTQEYFVLSLWSSYTSTVKSSEANNGDEKPNGDTAGAFRKEFAQCTKDFLLQAGAARAISTNTINTVSTPISTASPSRVFSAGGPDLTNNNQDDSQIATLEDIYDDKGAAADFTNLETTVNVSPIPTSRIHPIHHTTQILGYPTSVVQTRSKVNKSSRAHAFIEPKKISQALEDESWVDAMQEELLQFKIHKVWILVDLPFGKKAIGKKWVYRNKKDERGVIVRNKAKLVSQGYRQEEGIDYDECDEFEALMKSRFQMSSMGELTFFLRLQVKQKEDGIFISQDKYVVEILKKIDFMSVKTTSTLIETQKPLVKDEEAVDVDVHLYRSMIGSLMYLTASRPDIMFAVCACSRFQVTPKTSHLHAVKRIFRYLKGKPKLGLWYPRVSAFDLEAYSDSDYAGANLDRKSTTGGCQFLGRRLISWQCKKQTIMATSTIEAEYVAAANCCG
ncbi:putative ribonuclease H-like domain-containing protein, partial [Tanacetum coccineum]